MQKKWECIDVTFFAAFNDYFEEWKGLLFDCTRDDLVDRIKLGMLWS